MKEELKEMKEHCEEEALEKELAALDKASGNEELWQFIVRVLAHLGWTMLCGCGILVLPTLLMGILMFVAFIVGNILLVGLLDCILDDLEDGE